MPGDPRQDLPEQVRSLQQRPPSPRPTGSNRRFSWQGLALAALLGIGIFLFSVLSAVGSLSGKENRVKFPETTMSTEGYAANAAAHFLPKKFPELAGWTPATDLKPMVLAGSPGRWTVTLDLVGPSNARRTFRVEVEDEGRGTWEFISVSESTK